MSILLQCDKCWCRFSMKHKQCPKCGVKTTLLRRRFVVEARDAVGRKHVKVLGNISHEQAKEKELEFKKNIRHEQPAKLTIEVVCRNYIDRLKSLKRVYVNDTEHRLNEICRFIGKESDASKLDVLMVDSFRGMLLKRGLSRATCDRYFAAGRAAWNYSVNGINPWSKAGMLNPDNKITRYLSSEERDRLLIACSQISRQLYEIVFVALGTGLRKREILQLRRDQVDFKKGSVSVIAKGGDRRILYPSESVMELLQNIKNNNTKFFWIDNKTKKPHASYWRYQWKKALKSAALPEDFRFHDLRHDSATRAYAITGDIYLVQQLLGHTNLSTTMRYAHTEKKKIKRVFETIDPNGTSIGNNDKKE